MTSSLEGFAGIAALSVSPDANIARMTKSGPAEAPDLKECVRHLRYEIDMLTGLVDARLRLPAGDDNVATVLQNAWQESLLAHLRNLIEFVCGREPRRRQSDRWPGPRDIKPRLFVGGWTGAPFNLDGTLRRIDRELAHLTLNRLEVTPEDKEWPALRSDLELLLAHLRSFVAALGRDGSPWAQPVGDSVAALQQRLLAAPPEALIGGTTGVFTSAVVRPAWEPPADEALSAALLG